jgi:hypothetical protein
MPTYNDFRIVLKRIDFKLVRSKKHETWQKILPDRTILQLRLSHQYSKDIPKALFHKMLKQAQITEEYFKRLLG